MGVSFAGPEVNTLWIQDQGYQYEFWTDTNRELALYYGAVEKVTDFVPARVTRILDAEGVLVLEYAVGTHPLEVLADCQALFGP